MLKRDAVFSSAQYTTLTYLISNNRVHGHERFLSQTLTYLISNNRVHGHERFLSQNNIHK